MFSSLDKKLGFEKKNHSNNTLPYLHHDLAPKLLLDVKLKIFLNQQYVENKCCNLSKTVCYTFD